MAKRGRKRRKKRTVVALKQGRNKGQSHLRRKWSGDDMGKQKKESFKKIMYCQMKGSSQLE